jgi:hypothetical protein
MSRNRLTAAAAVTAAAAAAIAVLAGCATTHHAAAAPATRTAITHTITRTITRTVTDTPATRKPAAPAAPAAAPAVLWLTSAGGQAQVTFNQDVDTLAGDLETEAHNDSAANHLAFEADARTVRAQATKILATPALLPARNRAAYQDMLHKFITVADILQPGTRYGTTPQDYTAWWAALSASNITVS